MKRGKRIKGIENFISGEKYLHLESGAPFTFSHISDDKSLLYFLNEGQVLVPSTSNKHYFTVPSWMKDWYEAVEEELEDITLEVKFGEYCRDTSGKFDVNKETKNIVDNMMDMVKRDLGVAPLTGEVPKKQRKELKGRIINSSTILNSQSKWREGLDVGTACTHPDEVLKSYQMSGNVDGEVTVEQMLTDFNDTLSEEQKVAYEDMLGGGFDHVMVHIETLGTEPGCVILSVAAVRFNLETGVISDRFMKVVSIDSCIKLGLGIDGGTLTWWFNQSEEAREHLKGNSNTIKSVLHSLSQFFRSNDQVWGNSARFDLGILAEAYKKVDKKLPWDFWNERDVRTLVSFKPEVKTEVVFEGEPHDPIDDCIHQVNYCHLIWRLINK